MDMEDGGVNLFWPVHDQVYNFEGTLSYSSGTGFEYNFIEAKGTREEKYFETPVDPVAPDREHEIEEETELEIPLFDRSIWFIFTLLSFIVVSYHIKRQPRRDIKPAE